MVGAASAVNPLGLIAAPEKAAPTIPPDLDRLIRSKIDAKIIPGALLQVWHGGRPVIAGAWGDAMTRLHARQPVEASMRFCFFSYSKLVSATVIGTLLRDRLLSLDDRVTRFIPEYAAGGKEATTLLHALTHSAGIPNVPLGPVGTEAGWTEAVQKVCAAKADWEPGSKSAYHGLTGLFVAAAMARRALKNQPWEEIARERLFQPLGADTLTYRLPQKEDRLALVPMPTTFPAEMGKHGANFDGHPAGNCHGTAADALKVLQLHLQGGRWNNRVILDTPALEALHTVQYDREIAADREAGKPPRFQTWGAGPLLRGRFPADGSHSWFGFHDQKEPRIFGHAGIDTVIGVADPARQIALFFATTDSPTSNPETIALRNGVVNAVWASLAAR